jgi:4-diphosphocytidyl-2-C-methyl-D-erythritol kinase
VTYAQAVSSIPIIYEAPAKLNLNLLVSPLREDGFHNVDSIVCPISLADTLRAEPHGEISLICDRDVGPTEENLVYRAAVLLAESAGRSLGARIELQKHIPAGGGLGGASSDAATTLRALDALWQLSTPEETLHALAAQLGSDVPMFLDRRPARMTGRGEILAPIQLHPFWAVLCTPPIHCPTGPVYGAFDALPPKAMDQPDASLWLQEPESWAPHLENHLAAAAFVVRPALQEYADALAGQLARPVHVTGSGSSLFVLYNSSPAAKAALGSLNESLQPHCQPIASLG